MFSIKHTGLQPEYKTYNRQKCFVGHSHDAKWSEDILAACADVLPKFGLEPWYAADHFDPTKPLRDKVVQLIANARYGIYDLSSWQDRNGQWHMPRNVLIELGMAIALNRPVLLLRHTSYKKLPLPAYLQGLAPLEFTGSHTLKKALEKHLPQWFNVPPDREWLNRFCLFGNRVCDFREKHPRGHAWGQQTISCHIADGLNPDDPSFQIAEREEIRGAFEDLFTRYSDLSFDYLDELSLTDGYQFRLCSHCQAVRSTPFAIYRILPDTPAEVFITIGMSIALETLFAYDIPKIRLVHHEKELPSLLRGYEVVEAVNSSQVKKKLKAFIPSVMQQTRAMGWKPRALPFVEITFEQGAISKGSHQDDRTPIGFHERMQDTKTDITPETLVDEVKISLKNVLYLSAQDNWREVTQRGLYRASENQLVVIFQDAEVITITTANKLRSEILPRSWSGKLGDKVRNLPSPPIVAANTKVVELGLLVQDAKVDWLLVVDNQTQEPVGVLSSEVVISYTQPDSTPQESRQGARFRLWGTSESHIYYYCPIEKRTYSSDMVRFDVEGRMRDPKGHLVERVSN